ncbi:Putative Sister chromatid cohesion complex Cohesin, subunit RAD21/SCC1 [Rhizopus microsporus]|nr:Putative Sister chromatid cohesion complex Cohesin, subunit RAD21/SCC1 [Rhizopus microsporus]
MLTDQLTRQGPLARVWLASHWERKLSKSQFLQTNIEKTIDAIETNQEEEPSLRISGQLLLGVVRIYSRKTRYLLEDCNDALVKIKLAFKKGDVNMPDIHHSVANVNAITLQDKLTEFDILLPDVPLNQNLNGVDPILDSLDFSPSQDITLSGFEGGFFTDVEMGLRFDPTTEGGRRDQPGLADTAFEPAEISEPLKRMTLDDQTGLADNTADFGFDINDNLNYDIGADFHDTRFDLPSTQDVAEASLDTLMQVGIMPVDEQMVFDTEIVQEPATRKRKRLVVDKVTEIPQEDLRRYTSDTSSIVNRDLHFFEAAKAKPVIHLRGPGGNAVGAELEDMFTRISHKRLAAAPESAAHPETYLGAPTPAGEGLEPFGGFDYDVDIGTGGFDRERFEQTAEAEDTGFDFFETQATQAFNESTRRTLETIEGLTQFNGVKFAELVPTTSSKSEAAKRFYEVLLLASRDKIKVRQDQPYGDIQINAVAVH